MYDINIVSDENRIRFFDLFDDKYWVSVPEKIQIKNLISWDKNSENKENNIIDFYNSENYSSTIMTVITDKNRLLKELHQAAVI